MIAGHTLEWTRSFLRGRYARALVCLPDTMMFPCLFRLNAGMAGPLLSEAGQRTGGQAGQVLKASRAKSPRKGWVESWISPREKLWDKDRLYATSEPGTLVPAPASGGKNRESSCNGRCFSRGQVQGSAWPRALGTAAVEGSTAAVRRRDLSQETGLSA